MIFFLSVFCCCSSITLSLYPSNLFLPPWVQGDSVNVTLLLLMRRLGCRLVLLQDFIHWTSMLKQVESLVFFSALLYFLLFCNKENTRWKTREGGGERPTRRMMYVRIYEKMHPVYMKKRSNLTDASGLQTHITHDTCLHLPQAGFCLLLLCFHIKCSTKLKLLFVCLPCFRHDSRLFLFVHQVQVKNTWTFETLQI